MTKVINKIRNAAEKQGIRTRIPPSSSLAETFYLDKTVCKGYNTYVEAIRATASIVSNRNIIKADACCTVDPWV